MAQTEQSVVVDQAKSSWSDLWTKEDYLAIWLGFLIIATSLIAYLCFGPRAEFTQKIEAASQIQSVEADKAPFKTIAWYTAEDDKKKLKGSSSAFGKFVSHWTKKPGSWKDNPMDALIRTEAQAKAINDKAMPAYEEAKTKAQAALLAASEAEGLAAAGFADEGLNVAATTLIADWRDADKKAASAKAKASVKPYNYIPSLIGLCLFFIVIFGGGVVLMGQSFVKFAKGFIIVFLVTVFAYLLGGQALSKQYGFGAEAWGILLGMLIANTVGTPRWVLPACQVEFSSRPGWCCLAPRCSSARSWQSASPESSSPGWLPRPCWCVPISLARRS